MPLRAKVAPRKRSAPVDHRGVDLSRQQTAKDASSPWYSGKDVKRDVKTVCFQAYHGNIPVGLLGTKTMLQLQLQKDEREYKTSAELELSVPILLTQTPTTYRGGRALDATAGMGGERTGGFGRPKC